MGRINYNGSQKIARKRIVNGFDISYSEAHLPKCTALVTGKISRNALPKALQRRALCIIDLMHSDIAIPL